MANNKFKYFQESQPVAPKEPREVERTVSRHKSQRDELRKRQQDELDKARRADFNKAQQKRDAERAASIAKKQAKTIAREEAEMGLDLELNREFEALEVGTDEIVQAYKKVVQPE